ncbi:MAG: LysE family translocator [Bacteroidales bacterium]|jgi:threonine/homoserine/homoserine lactone efflux protein|nr:LysE family translocator [Bacteroidales bacterium]
MTDNLWHFISAGVLLGLSSGISPGPLLTLVLTQTIRHNRAEGIKVALSPLITDFPIIMITVLILGRLAQFDIFLAIISFIGAIFLAYLGVESLRTRELNFDVKDSKSGSLKKGIIANLLNPSPYLFWATVGTPLMFKAYKTDLLTSILFMISFYVFLTGSKIVVAFLVDRSKQFINQGIYLILMRILGVALLIFSLIFLYDGFKYL